MIIIGKEKDLDTVKEWKQNRKTDRIVKNQIEEKDLGRGRRKNIKVKKA